MLAAEFIPVRKRGEIVSYAMVDAEDYERLNRYRWLLNAWGYAKRGAGGNQTVLMHREVMGLGPGDPRLDHFDHDTLDNRKQNLRLATNQQNAENRRAGGDRGSSSRYRGVSFRKEKGRWQAYICVRGHQTHLGFFDDENEAGRVAHEARQQHMPYSTT